MKATQQKKFFPVTVILETQEEVDKVYALLDHAKLNKALDLKGCYSVLTPYRSPFFFTWTNKISGVIDNG